MGSATTQALAATTAALDATVGIDLDTARELFYAARLVGESSHLGGALSDPSGSPQARAALVRAIFGSEFTPSALALLTTVVSQRWSSAADLLDGIEDLAVRAVSVADAGTDVEAELFSVTRLVAENPELELALGSRLGDASIKGELVDTLLSGRVSAGTALIVASLVQQPAERRVRQVLGSAMRTVADQRGRTVATVVSATALSTEQTERLTTLLSKKYGREISLNTVIDPSVVGGLRVQVADDVIDASISARLAELRQRLAS